MNRSKHDLSMSERQLDDALQTFRACLPSSDVALNRVRMRLITEITQQSSVPEPTKHDNLAFFPTRTSKNTRSAGRSKKGKVLIAAAIAVPLIGVGMLAPSLSSGNGNTAAVANAGEALNLAASAAVTSVDAPIKPGQYFYIEQNGRNTVFAGTESIYQQETMTQEWVPANPADPALPWVLKTQAIGSPIWIKGSSKSASPGVSYDSPTQLSAPCGQFFPPIGNCSRPGSWQDPTPAFISGLPKDPDKLYANLRDAAPHNGMGSVELFKYAVDGLASGRFPADLRASVYKALTKIPGIKITDNATSLDGRKGIAFGMDDGIVRQEIIVDPASGQFIGQRQTLTSSDNGAPAGTLLGSVSVKTLVVSAVGRRS